MFEECIIVRVPRDGTTGDELRPDVEIYDIKGT